MPSAAEVTVAQTLELLDGQHAAVASAVANGGYVFWIGSGISRGRVNGLDGVIEGVLEFLRERAAHEGAASPHLRALKEAIDLAAPSVDERNRINFSEPVASWPDAAVLVRRLVPKYSRLLDIDVDGQPADYLLWDGARLATSYPPDAEPDCEHLAIAVLAREGVLTEAPSANWDGLIEAALTEVGGSADFARVVVLEEDLRAARGPLRLIKFHGCAVRAASDPDSYRDALMARASQISDWVGENQKAAIRTELVSLATTRPTLMIGLSAQDEDIKAVFSFAKANMPWRWPAAPPANVFSADELEADHKSILKIVYHADYQDNQEAIKGSALIRAYGAQLLTAFVLHVAVEKLRAFIATCDTPSLRQSDYRALGDGIVFLRNLAAAHADGDRLAFLRALIATQTRALALLREGKPPTPGTNTYQPISGQAVSFISTDPGLATGGMREAAVCLGVIGREAEMNAWSIDVGTTSQGRRGSLRITTTRGESAIFFAANPKAGTELEISGAAPDDAADVVVFHSTGPLKRMRRSPSASFGRTGTPRSRHVDMAELLSEAKGLTDLEQRFRQEAAL